MLCYMLYDCGNLTPNHKPNTNIYILVSYVNRLLDQINSNKIIHSSQSFYIFPASKYHLLNTGVTFKYSNTIRAKLLIILIEMLHVLAKITKNLLIITMVMLLQGISTLFIT